MAKVYLDSLLPREDFDVAASQNSAKKKESFSISDLRRDDFFYLTLRKPDFQRETNEWTPQKVCELIKSFINAELIPAIILWRSNSGFNFVIDGSHRLSSLIAWINDDYGDGQLTRAAYDSLIPDEQIEIANKTRRLINKEVGPYSEYKLALTNRERVSSDIASRAKSLASIAVQLQWVEGDADVAEASFFKINQQAAKIDPTELKLIQSRKKPNGIASRAIIKGGVGHQYWAKFSEANTNEIEILSKEINQVFFLPKVKKPIKTLDLPIGGKGYSTQSPLLIYDFVNIVNRDNPNIDTNDESGAVTISFLKKSRKIAYLLNSQHPSSLGLHPAVYFYSKTGRYKTASFFATVEFIMELEQKQRLKEFISIRATFEDLLIEYDFVIQQILRQYRESSKALPYIKKFYLDLMTELIDNKGDKEVSIKNILSKPEYNYIQVTEKSDSVATSNFSDETKSSIFITEALDKSLRCKICNARIHINSISIDHKIRKKDGGLGSVDNAQLTHPYCNTTIKN